MSRPRDSQLSKVFSAEHSLRSHPLRTRDETAAFALKVTRSAWWKKRFPKAVELWWVDNAEGDGNCWRTDDDRHTMTQCLYVARQGDRLQVLHQFAHVLQPDDVQLHGVEFMRQYLDLIERFMGRDIKRRFIELCNAAGVKTRGWSPEARERAKQRTANGETGLGRFRLERARDEVLEIYRDLTKGAS